MGGVVSWTILIAAGILEVGWAVGLKYTDGFRNPLPSALVVLAIGISIFLLAVAARNIPIGIAYSVWVGIGAVGTVVLGTILFKEPISLGKGLCLLMLLASIIGLKLVK
jgi:quaternary ammonium compound-resistance protein SugE